MGIMWTIISIEIVDSRKEIGILRSIGLSGGKVSFIFVFQCASVILLSYVISVIAAYNIVPMLNIGITDEFNKITLYMYTFTYRTPLYLAILVVAMTAISTVIPLFKILTQKIIDVINERDK
jgi:ABC-type lipoprotein release transport system permease subunit